MAILIEINLKDLEDTICIVPNMYRVGDTTRNINDRISEYGHEVIGKINVLGGYTIEPVTSNSPIQSTQTE